MSGTIVPGYWMNEKTGVLRPAVEAYLRDDLPLADHHIAALRAYFRQWMAGSWGPEEAVTKLRQSVDLLVSRETITDWLDDAILLGIDPL